jgi:hypothetical protein
VGCCEKRKKREEKERRWVAGFGPGWAAGERREGGRGFDLFFSFFANPFQTKFQTFLNQTFTNFHKPFHNYF